MTLYIVTIRFFRRVRRSAKRTVSFILSVCPHMERLGPLWADFHEIWYSTTFRKFAKKIQVSSKYENNNRTLHEDRYTFMITSGLILLGMRNISDKSSRQNQNTRFVFGNFFFENLALYELMWKKYSRQTTQDNNITQCGGDAICMPDE